ncbi:hypothetical protein VUR80DRAFT_3480 [Thermomyces stellatus]
MAERGRHISDPPRSRPAAQPRGNAAGPATARSYRQYPWLSHRVVARSPNLTAYPSASSPFHTSRALHSIEEQTET